MPFITSECTVENLISTGLTGSVHALSDSEVVKIPLDIEQRREIEIEKVIYERLTEDDFQHPGLLEYLGSEPFDNDKAWAIRLPRVDGDQLAKYLLKYRMPWSNTSGIEESLQLKWANQITEVLCYIHSKGVVHCDLGTHNILVDEDKNLKLIDFGGSSIDGSEPLVSCWIRNQPPWFDETGADEKADIFALGSVFYTIMTGHSPHFDRPNCMIPILYRAGTFPELHCCSPLERIIDRCWKGNYMSAHEVLADIQAKTRLYHRSRSKESLVFNGV